MNRFERHKAQVKSGIMSVIDGKIESIAIRAYEALLLSILANSSTQFR